MQISHITFLCMNINLSKLRVYKRCKKIRYQNPIKIEKIFINLVDLPSLTLEK